jgi:hypothetical protein
MIAGTNVKKRYLAAAKEFIITVSHRKQSDTVLYRGQSSNEPLLPKIARQDPIRDTTSLEKIMLQELRRSAPLYLGNDFYDDWDLLVIAQHYKMATRLLDWTSNPLVALWFACCDENKASSGFVYEFTPNNKYLLDRTVNSDPWDAKLTKIFKPNLNNERIIAQQGWFTAHIYAKKIGRFIALGKHKSHSRSLVEIEVPGQLKSSCLDMLNTFGINRQSLFPDLEGMCRHINWLNKY